MDMGFFLGHSSTNKFKNFGKKKTHFANKNKITLYGLVCLKLAVFLTNEVAK
jgi:hypothetical protein